MPNEHDIHLEREDSSRQTPRAKEAENQSTAVFESEPHASIKRPNNYFSSSAQSDVRSVNWGPPSTHSVDVLLPSLPPPPRCVASQNNVQLGYHSDNDIPLNEMAREALYESARRKKEAQRYCASIETRRDKIKLSPTGAKRSTIDNMDRPTFDVVAFEQLLIGDDDRPLYALPLQAAPITDQNRTVNEYRTPRQPFIQGDSDSHYFASSHSGRASRGKRQNSHKFYRWNKRHTHSNTPIHNGGDDDARSKISQGSESSYSNVFTTTCIKLKGYLKHSDYRKSKDKSHNRTSTNCSPSSDSLFNLSENSIQSGRKTPKYISNKTSAESVTVTTEEESTCSAMTSFLPSACNIVNVATKNVRMSIKGPAPSRKTSDVAAQVSDLPWLEHASDGRLHGLYSGPINDILQPHGEGALVLEGNNFLKFYGNWVNGELVSPLINDDEKREQECASSNEFRRKSSVRVNIKKPSKENEKKPRKYRKKPSKECRGISSISSVSSDYSDITRRTEDPLLTKSATSDNKPSHHRQTKQKYDLGDIARTPRDMVIHRSKDKAIHYVSLLKKYDQAFLKRSNGLWMCSALADRGLQPTTDSGPHWYAKHEIDQETMELEECMLFVVNEDGATKIVKKRHWGRIVRCLQQDDQDK